MLTGLVGPARLRGLLSLLGVLSVAVAGSLAVLAPPAAAAKHKSGHSKQKPASKKSLAAVVAHPCSVMSIGQIASALGTAPSVPAKVNTNGECDYSSAAAFNFVNIQIQTSTLKQFFKQDAAGAEATQAVTGLGNQAFVTPANLISSNGAGSIFVLVGTTTLRIDVYAGAAASNLETLARDALGKL